MNGSALPTGIKIPDDLMKIGDNLAACSLPEGFGRDVLAGNIARALLDERQKHPVETVTEKLINAKNGFKNNTERLRHNILVRDRFIVDKQLWDAFLEEQK